MSTAGFTPDQRYVHELSDAIERIWDIALRNGLDPFPVHFELVPATIMYEFGSYGLPGRFSHWSRGKAYYRMKTEYDYGLSKIYELVVNTNPSYAFLMEQNDLLQNKVVVAHVLGHTDMFKNNVYFKHTSRNMIDRVSTHAERIRQYEFDHSVPEVERFLDAVLAIEEHIDPNFQLKTASTERGDDIKSSNGPTSPYEDLWSLAERRVAEHEAEERRSRLKPGKFPPEPVKDLLLFLAEHAPSLEEWQRDILLVVRDEMRYFVPQMQTKILNEGWACLVGNSLVCTNQGLLRYESLFHLLGDGELIDADSGNGQLDPISDRHIHRNARTIRLRTRRGLVLEGAEEHRLGVGPEEWIALKDVQVGQRIHLRVGGNVWAQEYVPISVPERMTVPTVEDVAVAAGVGVHTVYRHFEGKTPFAADRIKTAVMETKFQLGHVGKPLYAKRRQLVGLTQVTEELGEFLGYLTGDGNIHSSKRSIGYTSGDRELVDRYAQLVEALFGIIPRVFWDPRTINGNGGRWRVHFHSVNVLEMLQSLGIDLDAKAPQKRIPDVILRSPKSVVGAFLRAYFDCDGCASLTAGVILSTFSEEIAQTLQVVLLNYGILSRRHGPNTHITGSSAAVFEREIGFGLERKRAKLRKYVAERKWFKIEDPTDEVVRIERDVADVYDITVERSHQYVANGMLHHNSFWHARIMRDFDLSDADFTAFAQMHSGVLAPQRMRINPYHLGYKILEDIERRWDHPTEDELAKGQLPGQGRQKIFEVREIESDLSLLRNYLTKDLVEDLDLYLYRKEGDEWVIVEKNWERVRDGIIASMTNFGYPYITVVDADFNGNSELVLRHHHEGQDLDLAYAQKTLEYVQYIWSRPVYLETVIEDQSVRLGYNGEKHIRQNLGEKEAD